MAEELDTAYFDELRLNMDFLADGTFYLLDGNNTIITAGNTTEQKSLKSFVTNSSERNDFHEKWVAIDHEANPSGEIRYKYGGQNYITYYANVENTDWSIRVTENLSAQEESVKSYSVLIVVILGILAVGDLQIPLGDIYVHWDPSPNCGQQRIPIQWLHRAKCS